MKLHPTLVDILRRAKSRSSRKIHRRFAVAILTAALLVLISTPPAHADYLYRMVVTNSTGATLYLWTAPWDQQYAQSSCISSSHLGTEATIPVGQSYTLTFSRSSSCSGLQGWLSLRASNKPGTTGIDYQMFWFSNDGGLEKHGLNSTYQNQLSRGGGGVYFLDVLTATDIGHDWARYGYRMTVRNATAGYIYLTRISSLKA